MPCTDSRPIAAGAPFIQALAMGAFLAQAAAPALAGTGTSSAAPSLQIMTESRVNARTPQIPASVPEQPGAAYAWTIAQGSSKGAFIMGGAHTSTLTYMAGKSGTLTLSCRVTWPSGASATSRRKVQVMAKPMATISAASKVRSGNPDERASVPRQTGCSYRWSLKNGVLAEGQGQPSIRYTPGRSGKLQLRCLVVSSSGKSKTGTRKQTVLAAPSAEIQTVAASSRGQSGLIASVPSQKGCRYRWQVQNGEIQSGAASPAITWRMGTGGCGALLACTVTGPSGVQTTGTRQVSLQEKPIIRAFSAASPFLRAGTPTTLDWRVEGADSVAIDPAIGTVQGNRLAIQPNATTTYTLTATNAFGSTRARTTVSVIAQDPCTRLAIEAQTPSMTVHAAQPLTAIAADIPEEDLVWSVDGIAGGNSDLGRILGTGKQVFYTAPALPGRHVLGVRSQNIQGCETFVEILVEDIPSEYRTTPTREINVKEPPFSAKGDGVTDDTQAIQKAIDSLKGQPGTVWVPSGVYRINPTAVEGKHGLLARTNLTLKLAPDAILEAIPVASEHYSILSIDAQQDVTLIGGVLKGDRNHHLGTTGEWGMGLSIVKATRVTVESTRAIDCWGDGFYIGWDSNDVLLSKVVADNNRRQGASITWVNRLRIKNSLFTNTHGTAPQAGLDIEPNAGQRVEDVEISECTISGNAGAGVSCGQVFPNTYIGNVLINHCGVILNGHGTAPKGTGNGVQAVQASGTTVQDSILALNRVNGIEVMADGVKVTGSLILGNTNGIFNFKSSGCIYRRNTIKNQTAYGIYIDPNSSGTVLDQNVLINNGK